MCKKQKAPAATEAQNKNIEHLHSINSCNLPQDLYLASTSQYYDESNEYDLESGLRILDDFEESDLQFLNKIYAGNGGCNGY